ncbi:hypothetical protein Zmor_004072 [Zophobas morio]|uniref:Reverse transcriptase domain-containing protein n=1 Tax=Zophobas morio TaxID=2755281 RepID=A0AA38M1Z9_9CUCU|nr:hypothetical protein Zmor_004072 [Zophobas morio]
MINDLILSLNGSKWFSEIDLKSAFHQIELEESNREITTFATCGGLYRFKRLFFGINCAPEIFQRIMEQLAEDLHGVEIYVDDFLVHGKTLEEHNRNLLELLKRLENSGITVNKGKCKIAQKKLEFMGHEISEEGVRPLRSRIETIKNFRAPKTKTELSSFLGLVGFCSKFIPEYSALTAPLRKLIRKDVQFQWRKEQSKAFERLKGELMKSKTLGFFDPRCKSTIIADASPYGIGAVLVQMQNGGEKIIEYASRALTDADKKYSQTEKEALSLVWACERFHLYVYGAEFDIITDHKPLEFIFSPRSKPCARVERWVMRLMGYNFNVIYQPGKKNIADPLSRLTDTNTKSNIANDEHHVRWVAKEAVPYSMSIEEIREKSTEMQDLRDAIREDKYPVRLRKNELIKTELCIIDDVVLRGTRILISPSLRQRVLKLAMKVIRESSK